MKKTLSFLFSILLLIACGGDDAGGGDNPSGGSEYLNVQSITVSGDATTATINIQASNNCDWVITYNDSWIRSITPTKGRGTQDVTIQLYENTQVSERTAIITVKSTSGAITRNPTITQLGNVETLSLSETSLDFTSSAESKQVTVSSNTHWVISGRTNWMTVIPESGEGNGIVTITVQENTSSERSAILTFTSTEGKTQMLTIKQAGAATPTTLGVTYPQVSNIRKHEAEVTFSYNFETTVTTYGVCYSTSSDPTIEKNPYVSKSGTDKQGSATFKLESLSSATTYYVRAYVVTNGGTQYSNSTSFTTETSYPGGGDNPTP